MSRFKPSLTQVSSPAPFRAYEPLAFGAGPASVEVSPPVGSAPPASPDAASDRTLLDKVGFVIFCIYMISGFANEWAMRLGGDKAYISAVALVMLPIVWLLSGKRLRGLSHPMGYWWIAFLIFLLLDTPFSVWKGGSVDLLKQYLPRAYLVFFILTCFVTTLKQCVTWMYVGVASATIVLLSCFKFGMVGLDDGRFRIPDSLFFSNSNDLALQLLLGVTQFMYLFYKPGIFRKAFAAICIAISVMYMLKTGSRGCMLAALLYAILIFVFSRNKVLVLMLAVLVGAVGFMSLPTATMRRLMLLGFDDRDAQTMAEDSAIESASSRKELLKRSIVETFKHPLFGVGPGQFAVAVAGEKLKRGEYATWLGTHNSYTQVSSECGIPAFICYIAVTVLCFRLNYRVYRASRDDPRHTELTGLAFTLLSGTLVYATCTFFFHMAYTAALPALSASTVCVYLLAKPVLGRALDPREPR